MPSKVLRFEDSITIICYHNISNRSICTVLGVLQFAVAIVAGLQHIYSLWSTWNTEKVLIFNCQFDLVKHPNASIFLAFDVIIYDYGLFFHLLGASECVANYVDGGYMRSFWCINYPSAIIIMFIGLYANRPMPSLLRPFLLIQSIYALGLLVLTLASLPKLLRAIFSDMTQKLFMLICIYGTGAVLNNFFNIVAWHSYWNLKSAFKAHRKRMQAVLL